MEDLFEPEQQNFERNSLSVKMRPEILDEYVGQQHLLGEGKILRKLIEKDNIPSMILFGPPGCGKTALAFLIAHQTKKPFYPLNAVTSTVSDVREVIKIAREKFSQTGKSTILFLDEISHFNKLQQDALMRDVEEGIIILIGTTTHNPYFYINTPLLSRCTVFELKPLTDEDIERIIKNAIKDRKKGLGNYNLKITEEAIKYIVKSSEGDARKSLNTLEIGVSIAPVNSDGVINFDIDIARECMQKKYLLYDREDQHYDTISAFIKSMRGSDPDAAIYYLAKMIASGEDPKFIARRILICASEDVGNADPQALLIANACYQAVEVIGMPESRIILAQATIYVATAPKSNSSYLAIEKAIEDVESEKTKVVPEYLQHGGYKGAEELKRGQGYIYPHDYPYHYYPQKYVYGEKNFYIPTDIGYEKRIKSYLNFIERLKKEYEKRGNKERNKEQKRKDGEGGMEGKKYCNPK